MIDEHDVDAALGEAQVGADDREDPLPEAPAVANIRVWIQGYGVIFTVRGEKMLDIVKKTTTLIDYAESHGWANTWVKENPIPKPKSYAEKDRKMKDEDSCFHEHITLKQSTGHNKPENKGRYYESCLDCGRFMGWKEDRGYE